jgi:hypothetical protein
MGFLRLASVFAIAALGSGAAASAAERPLVIGSQGSFFVGGEVKAVTPPTGGNALQRAGDITVNQMYVQYQIPAGPSRHLPVVMVHGCCLSSKTWETTPDGRMGWNEYFLRKDRPVYLADQVSRARSGFDPSVMAAVKSRDDSAERAAQHHLGYASAVLGAVPLRIELSARLRR